MKPPITLVASTGKERRIRSYTLCKGFVNVPRGILTKLGVELGFLGPDYWTHAVTSDGKRLKVVGYTVAAERGNRHKISAKDFTSVDQMNNDLYATE